MSKKIDGRVQELHAKFVGYGRNAREWVRKCVMLLPEIERERVWEKKGFGSVYEYAGKLAGMSREMVNDALRVLRATENMPAIRAVIEERGINAVKPVVTALTAENEMFWAEKVRSMSQHALQVFRHELEGQVSDNGRGAPSENVDSSQQQAIYVVMSLDPELAVQLEKLCVASGGDWNVAMRKLLEARNAVLEQEQPEAVDASSRHIPVEIERFVIKRSGGVCEFPKCTRKYVILHHTQRFVLEEVHDPARLVALCVAHERLVHLGLIAYEEERPDKWAVRKEADKGSEETEESKHAKAKYAVDQKVQKFRRPG